MTRKGKTWNYCKSDELESRLLELPYLNKDYGLIIVLPNDRNGLNRVKTLLKNNTILNALSEMKKTQIDIFVPKFRVEQSYSLKSSLSTIPEFKKLLNELDLSRINGRKNLIVSDVVHKAVFAIDEKGSEASAGTGLGVLSRSIPEVFIADHPFIYFIKEKTSNFILFIGQINQFGVKLEEKDMLLRLNKEN